MTPAHSTTLVNPMDETVRERGRPATRLEQAEGAIVGLLDISKPGGNFFLDTLERLLLERHRVARVIRVTKPTFARPAPEASVRELIEHRCQAVIEALAD